jgi:hypothetical protein
LARRATTEQKLPRPADVAHRSDHLTHCGLQNVAAMQQMPVTVIRLNDRVDVQRLSRLTIPDTGFQPLNSPEH